jgi:hypothetical protein
MFVGLIDKVAVPDPLMDDVLSDAATPVGLATANVTVELNPFRRLRLIVEDPCAPVLIDRLDGFADKPKSWKLNVEDAEWVKLPVVPVIVSV